MYLGNKIWILNIGKFYGLEFLVQILIKQCSILKSFGLSRCSVTFLICCMFNFSFGSIQLSPNFLQLLRFLSLFIFKFQNPSIFYKFIPYFTLGSRHFVNTPVRQSVALWGFWFSASNNLLPLITPQTKTAYGTGLFIAGSGFKSHTTMNLLFHLSFWVNEEKIADKNEE